MARSATTKDSKDTRSDSLVEVRYGTQDIRLVLVEHTVVFKEGVALVSPEIARVLEREGYSQ